MRQMKARTVLEGIEHHAALGVRVYADCSIQKWRIEKARHYVKMAMLELGPGVKTIVELGCGVMDISGPFSRAAHEVIGVDCNPAAIIEAKKLYPEVVGSLSAIEDVEPFECDVVVLCEVLEHLYDPESLVRKWLPNAKACVISHPLDEPLDSGLSAGDHCWSYSEGDLRNWFAVGGHNQREGEKFQMGSYTIRIARGVKA
jgi:Methyltransferase domain